MPDEFIRAVLQNDIKRVRRDLDNGRDPNLADEYGWTALHRAATTSHVEIAQLLIRAGSSLTAQGTEGWTPLHLAAASESKAVLALLIKAGADVNALSTRGDTPLHLCVKSDRVTAFVGTEAARCLLKAGARVDVVNNKGLSPLTKADSLGASKLATLFRKFL